MSNPPLVFHPSAVNNARRDPSFPDEILSPEAIFVLTMMHQTKQAPSGVRCWLGKPFLTTIANHISSSRVLDNWRALTPVTNLEMEFKNRQLPTTAHTLRAAETWCLFPSFLRTLSLLSTRPLPPLPSNTNHPEFAFTARCLAPFVKSVYKQLRTSVVNAVVLCIRWEREIPFYTPNTNQSLVTLMDQCVQQVTFEESHPPTPLSKPLGARPSARHNPPPPPPLLTSTNKPPPPANKPPLKRLLTSKPFTYKKPTHNPPPPPLPPTHNPPPPPPTHNPPPLKRLLTSKPFTYKKPTNNNPPPPPPPPVTIHNPPPPPPPVTIHNPPTTKRSQTTNDVRLWKKPRSAKPRYIQDDDGSN